MSLHWTPEARARVSSVRGPTPRPPVDLEATWARLRTSLLRPDTLQVDPALAHTHAAFRAALARAALPTHLDAEALAVWARVGTVSELVEFGCALFGVERMVDAWLHTREIDVLWRADPSQPQRVARRLERVPPTLPAPMALALRAPLRQAAPEVRARVHAKVAPLTSAGDLRLLAAALTLFPEEIPWARALAAAYLAAPAQAQGFVVVTALHRSACPLDELRDATLTADGAGGDYETLLDTHGEAALPLLLELLDAVKSPFQRETIARALHVARAPEVAAKLAQHVGQKQVRKHVDAYFQRFPELAEAALAPVAAKKGRAATMAAAMLALARRADAASEEEVPDAPLDALPAVLARPPWRGGARAKRKPVVVLGLALDGPLDGALAGPRAWHGASLTYAGSALEPPAGWTVMNDAESRAWLEQAPAHRPTSRGDAKTNRALDPAVRLEAWNRGRFVYEYATLVSAMLEVHGLEAAPGALAWARHHLRQAQYAFQVAPLADLELPELAPEMAAALDRRSTRDLAWRWLCRFPVAAITGLLPTALGETGTRRAAAERALRALAREGHDLRAPAAALGKKALAALDELLGWDPLSECPTKPPKLSARYRPESLVRPRLQDGRALPLEAMRHLDEMLAFTPVEPPYAGLELVREACEPRSLAEHAWSLARAWETSGARKGDDWMLRALVHFADDELVRRMPALQNKGVVEVLLALGTDAAATELSTLATCHLGPRAEAADAALDRLAEARGLARDRLDEQLTPTLGLDARGELLLDYGPRRFRVRLDEHLVPHVHADDGTTSKTLPRKRRGDDPAKIAQARAQWDALRDYAAALAYARPRLLERAMRSGATWSVAEIESAWFRHPVLTHLARRVVFVAQREGEPPRTFRVAEDGTYVGVDHLALTLAPDARVGVPHPLRWPEEPLFAEAPPSPCGTNPSLTAWREMLVDYEIVQPFPQLARPLPTVDESWLDSPRITVPREPNPQPLAERRHLVDCGWIPPGQAYRLDLDDGRFVLARSQVRYQAGAATHHLELLARRGDDEIPWHDLPRAVLLRVLDDFA